MEAVHFAILSVYLRVRCVRCGCWCVCVCVVGVCMFGILLSFVSDLQQRLTAAELPKFPELVSFFSTLTG